MSNIEFGITLKADGSGLVGVVNTAEKSLSTLGSTGKEAWEQITSGANKSRDGITSISPASNAADASLKRLGVSGKESGEQIYTGANKGREGVAAIASEANKLSEAIAKVGHYGSAYLGISQFVQYGHAVIETQTAMDRFNSSIAIASGSTKAAAGEFDYIRGLSNRLGLELMGTANAYASFSAAARGTSLEGKKVHDIFDAVAGVTAKMGLNGEQGQGVFLALSQMMSKGVVSAEEFRQQLGERLPIATAAGAAAMKVSTAEFTNMLNSGKLLSEDFLPKFAVALNEMSGGNGPVHTLQASLNRVSNNFTEIKLNLADSAPLHSAADGLASLTSHTQVLSASFAALAVSGIAFAALKVGDTARSHVSGIMAQNAALVEQRAATLAQNAALVEQRAATLANSQAAVVAAEAEVARTAALARSAATYSALGGATTLSRAATIAHTQATAVHTTALMAETAATTASTASTGLARSAVALLGGPIGVVTLLLGAGAAAWMLWGNSAAEATKKAAAEMDANIADIKAKAAKAGLSDRAGLNTSLAEAQQSRDQQNAAYQQDPQNLALRDKAIKAGEYVAKIKQELADLDTYERNLANKPVDHTAWNKLHQTKQEHQAAALKDLDEGYQTELHKQNMNEAQKLALTQTYLARKAELLAKGEKKPKTLHAQSDPVQSDIERMQMEGVKAQLQASGISAASAADQVKVYESALKGLHAVEKLRAEGHLVDAVKLQAKNDKELVAMQLATDATIKDREALLAQTALTKANEQATSFINKMNEAATQSSKEQEFQITLLGQTTSEVARLTAVHRVALEVEKERYALREKYKDNPLARDAAVAKLDANEPAMQAAAGESAAKGAAQHNVNAIAQAGGGTENDRYKQQLAAQADYAAATKQSAEENARAVEAIEKAHQDNVVKQILAGNASKAQLANLDAKTTMAITVGSLTSTFAELGKHNKAAFEADKIMKTGNAVTSTYSAAIKAYDAMAGIPYVGPALGVAAAAAAISFGMAQVSAIQSASFGGGGGGGGGAPSAPSISNSQAPFYQPSAGSAPASNTTTTNQTAHVTLIMQALDPASVSDAVKQQFADSITPAIQAAMNRNGQNVAIMI